jgi:hypothetical protein
VIRLATVTAYIHFWTDKLVATASKYEKIPRLYSKKRKKRISRHSLTGYWNVIQESKRPVASVNTGGSSKDTASD